jgi:hypothetical protein
MQHIKKYPGLFENSESQPSREELRASLDELLGRVFSSISCNGVDISDEPIEWPNQLGEAVSIQDLSPRDERPMVEGIASILRKVHDIANRREITKAQIREFKRDGIRFDYAEFLELCGL